MRRRTVQALLSISALLGPLLEGPTRRLEAVDRSRTACQLADDAGRVVAALATAQAVALPHALIADALPDTHAPLSIGHGALRVGENSYRPARWWRPSRPVLAGVPVRASMVDDLTEHWPDQLGLGPGLTPYHDDVLCGALVVLAATATAPELRGNIAANDLERRTTATSAALIRLACDGWCISAVADHLSSVGRGFDNPLTRARLLAVGHSSGRGLLAGMTAMLSQTFEEAA
jgi:Protein of unknown function (DUF2877)